eukprot:Gb_19170 [translate_table: standard]
MFNKLFKKPKDEPSALSTLEKLNEAAFTIWTITGQGESSLKIRKRPNSGMKPYSQEKKARKPGENWNPTLEDLRKLSETGSICMLKPPCQDEMLQAGKAHVGLYVECVFFAEWSGKGVRWMDPQFEIVTGGGGNRERIAHFVSSTTCIREGIPVETAHIGLGRNLDTPMPVTGLTLSMSPKGGLSKRNNRAERLKCGQRRRISVDHFWMMFFLEMVIWRVLCPKLKAVYVQTDLVFLANLAKDKPVEEGNFQWLMHGLLPRMKEKLDAYGVLLESYKEAMVWVMSLENKEGKNSLGYLVVQGIH